MLLKTQCFCGNDWNPDYTPTQVDMSECEGKRCDGNLTEWCGDDDRMLGTFSSIKNLILNLQVFTYYCSGTRIPVGHACLDDSVTDLPFCDTVMVIIIQQHSQSSLFLLLSAFKIWLSALHLKKS